MVKSKLNLLGIILLAVSAVGLVLTIVGLAVPWFAVKREGLIEDSTLFGLFYDKLGSKDFPIGCVRVFAIITFILVAIATAAQVLKMFGILRLKPLYYTVYAGVVVLFAALTFIFGLVYAGEQIETSLSSIGGISFVLSAGGYLLLFGAILAAAPLCIKKN